MVPPALDSEFLRSLPDPPNLNVADIRGNTTDAEKRLHAKGFFHLQTGEFGKDICRGLRLTSLSFDDDSEKHQCELILEIEIVKGVLHGACTTLLAEMCIGANVVMLGARMKVDARVFTRSMEITFARPAFIGDTIEVISTSTILNNTPSARCELRNKKSGKICATVLQSLSKPPKLKL
ncbi:hypothetical protein DFH06DRAFT_128351 [Mycena polygramma]|nr:hypothetical protein DFH06DRAFT_128351 [Mycena polygramma]